MGDYSYGVYIYAFPIQQCVAATFPGVSVFALMSIAGALTVGVAIASWHLLEQHALALKDMLAEETKRLLGLPNATA